MTHVRFFVVVPGSSMLRLTDSKKRAAQRWLLNKGYNVLSIYFFPPTLSLSLCLLAPIIFYLISVYKIPAHNKLKWIYWNPLHIAIFEITDKKHQISIIYSVYLPFGKCIMCIASFVDFIAVWIEYLQSISLLHHIMKYSVNGSYSLYAGGAIWVA